MLTTTKETYYRRISFQFSIDQPGAQRDAAIQYIICRRRSQSLYCTRCCWAVGVIEEYGGKFYSIEPRTSKSRRSRASKYYKILFIYIVNNKY